MRQQKLRIALPDTILTYSPHYRDKTIKLGAIARSCSIFRIQNIYIYRDVTERTGEGSFIKTILEFLDTPQYLRKHLYGKRSDLKYVGLLPPLRTPHHKLLSKSSEVRLGEYREGVIVEIKGRLHANVGLSRLIPIEGNAAIGSRVTVKITSEYPHLRGRVHSRDDVEDYWGYEVKEVDSLKNFIRNIKTDLLILTSRRGAPINEVWYTLIKEVKEARHIVVVFGSPKSSVYEILSEEGAKPNDFSKYVLNTIPLQGTATIRTEEALLGTLAVLNLVNDLGAKVYTK